ncbi:MAG: TIGR04076 family protein [bacterium]
MAYNDRVGYKVVGVIKKVKGFCKAGHKPGDEIELSGHGAGGLCGFFYHELFPYIIMLQFGGSFPIEWEGDPDVINFECLDKKNAVTLELRRIKE